MAQVFISYSRRDAKEFALKLRDAFAAQKREAWMDLKDIPVTAEWLWEVFTNIEATDNILFVISPESVTSDNYRKEIDHPDTRFAERPSRPNLPEADFWPASLGVRPGA